MVYTACGVGNQITPVLSWKVGGGVCWGQSPDGSTFDHFLRRYSSGGTVLLCRGEVVRSCEDPLPGHVLMILISSC